MVDRNNRKSSSLHFAAFDFIKKGYSMNMKAAFPKSTAWIIEAIKLPSTCALVCVIEKKVEFVRENEKYYSALFSVNKNLFQEENVPGCGIYQLTERAIHYV